MVATGFEHSAAFQKRSVQINRALYRRPIDRCCDAVQFCVGCVQQDYAPLRKQTRIQTRESRAERLPGRYESRRKFVTV